MLNIDIEKILKEYKTKKAYVETTLARIEQYKYAIAHPEMWYKDYIPASSPLGMPGNPNGSKGSIVESYVIGKNLNEDIIKSWIEQDESRVFFKKLEIEQIDNAMKSLSKQEIYIIELKYLEGMFWKDIELSYNTQFRQKNYVTYEALKKVNKEALNKLTTILEPFYNQFRVA